MKFALLFFFGVVLLVAGLGQAKSDSELDVGVATGARCQCVYAGQYYDEGAMMCVGGRFSICSQNGAFCSWSGGGSCACK